MTWDRQDRDLPMRYLIHDHDPKFTERFDPVFEAEGIEIVAIPFEAPNAHSIAERWARSAREECLDRLIILNERHLRRAGGGQDHARNCLSYPSRRNPLYRTWRHLL
jgi:hypothetical protein